MQQLRVGNLRRIELDQHRLGVAGGPAGHFLVGRIRGLPAGVAYRRRDDTWDFAQPLLDAPETALSEDGQLVLAGRRQRRAVAGISRILAAGGISDHEVLPVSTSRGSDARRRDRERDAGQRGHPQSEVHFAPAFSNSGRYLPYPSASSLSTGTKRSEAEFMQYRRPVGAGPSSKT